MEELKVIIDIIAKCIEVVGVLVISLGTFYSLYHFVKASQNKKKNAFIELRERLGKSILLGLEILIGADIMSTVVTQPTLASLSVLGLIILIRTFLSLSLQVELDGKFPWQKRGKEQHQ